MRRVLTDIVLKPDRASLLRVCLFEGGAWQTAWTAWLSEVHDPKSAFAGRDEGLKGLLPLLLVAARRSDATVDPGFLTHIRTAYFRESIRFERYAAVCREVSAMLSGASVESVVLRGSALAASVYPEVAVRHSGGLTLWVKNVEQMTRAREVLIKNGSTQPEAAEKGATSVTLEHSSRMRIVLQTDLFPMAYYNPPHEEIWARTLRRNLAGTEARVLSAADSLLEVCGRTSISEDRRTLRWACDAWLLIQKDPSLDWDVLVATAVRSGLALPLLVTLEYLSTALDARVPADVLTQLGDAVRRDPLGCELAIRSLQRAQSLSLTDVIFRPAGWLSRASLARRLLLPSPQFMRWRDGLREDAPVRWLYLRRLKAFLVDRGARA
jgi:hypothetical protein